MSEIATGRPLVQLSQECVSSLPASVALTTYSRASSEPAVVHFGVGAFHRSHQAVYLDELMDLDSDPSWGICGVGLMESDASVLDNLRKQDYLYSVSTYTPDGTLALRVVRTLQECLWAPVDRPRILDRLENPSTKIVSLTITEGGYNVNEATGAFDLGDAAIRDELRKPSAPASVFGYIVEGLRLRRAAGLPPFTVLSCDNIEGNGTVLRQGVLSYAEQVDPDLASWIAQEATFPCSMVDRITPISTPADAERVSRVLGCRDAVPVVAESFRQWVIQDDFPAGRPQLERVGVQFVKDVRPFEMMKLRLLNGAHQALGYLAVLLGFEKVHEAARDPLLDRFLRAYLFEEAASTLPEIADVQLADYINTVRQRFMSSYPPDTVARLTEDGSDHLPKFVLPVIRDRLHGGQAVDLGAHILAAWALHLHGQSESGTVFVVRDRRLAELQAIASNTDRPRTLLERRDLFGDVADYPGFAASFSAAHDSFLTSGIRQTLADVLSRPRPASRQSA